MRLDHARDLKREIRDTLKPQVTGYALRKDADPRAAIAVGVTMDEARDAAIVLLCQTRRAYHSDAADKAVRMARGEARKLYVGPIRRRVTGAWRRPRRDPLTLGASIGHRAVGAGTLGCFVERRGVVCILSNNHVIANVNAAEIGDPILHPGRLDAGRAPPTVCGTLEYFQPIDLDGRTANSVDCAVASVAKIAYDARSLLDPATERPVGTLGAAPQTEALPGMRVGKVGRTTGLTRGEVLAIEVDNVRVAMGTGGGDDVAVFDGQIAVSSRGRQFSKPGDSGSIVWDEAFAPLGLLFAGGDAPSGDGYLGTTFVNPIAAVLKAVDATIFTGAEVGVV